MFFSITVRRENDAPRRFLARLTVDSDLPRMIVPHRPGAVVGLHRPGAVVVLHRPGAVVGLHRPGAVVGPDRLGQKLFSPFLTDPFAPPLARQANIYIR